MKHMQKFGKIRLTFLVVLTALLVLSLSIATYAWFRDSIDTPNPTVVTTGKIDVKLTAHKQVAITDGSTGWSQETLYDSTPDDGSNIPQQDSALLGSSLYSLDLNSSSDEIYFVVEKSKDSIDVELVLSFVLNTQDDFINGFSYYLTKITPTSGETIEDILNAESVKTVTPTTSLNSINGDSIDATLNTDKTEEFVVFRLTCNYVSGNMTENAYSDKYYPINVNFSVGQIGSLSDELVGNTWRVSSEAELRNALLNYQTNDSIYVITDIIYNADLVLDHPVSLYVRGTLKINGNLNLTFADTGEFLIDTQTGGKIIVTQVGQSGNFIIDAPNAHVSMVGSGNAEVGGGDIYVQNRFSVLASYARGVDIYRAYIYDYRTTSSDSLDFDLKQLNVGQSTLLTIATRTTAGTIVATSGTTLIKVINNGTIEHADFSAMSLDITNTPLSPQLIVENYGVIGKEGTDYSIVLNNASRPCYVEGQIQTSGNTRLINRLGAQILDGTSGEPVKAQSYFIETDINVDYVVAVNGEDYTDIIVNYANLYDEEGVAIPTTSLADVLAWYFNNDKENDLYLVKKMKINCYNNKELTEEDYATINKMTQLAYLDLSNCVSENETFGRLTNVFELVELVLPEDKQLPANAFLGTSIEEIIVPSSYVSIDGDAFINSTGLIKYVHLKALNRYETLTLNEGQYLFVSDDHLVEEYRNTTDDHALKARVFLEAERHGDYFVRFVSNSNVEIATYVGASFDYAQESIPLADGNDISFNFDTLTLTNSTSTTGTTYFVVGYDAYSFYNKLTTGTAAGLHLTKISNIGAYAFYETNIFTSISLASDSDITIGEYAFYGVNATFLTITAKSVYIGPNAFDTFNTNSLSITSTGTVEIAEYAFYATTASTLTVDAKSLYIASSAFENSKTTGIDITATGDVEIAKRAFYATTLATGTTAVPFVINAGGAVVIGSEAFRDNVNKKHFKITDFTISADTIDFLNDFTTTADSLASYAFEAASISGNIELTATKSLTIGHNAFQSTENTKAITLTAETIYTGTNSFKGATGEAIVTITASNATLDQETFANAKITSLTATVEEDFTVNNRVAENAKITSLTITSQTVTIGSEAFKGCGALVNINVVGVGTIAEQAFSNNVSLLEVVAPSITSVGLNTFSGCYNLLAVVMPALVDIGVKPSSASGAQSNTSAFYGCSKLKYVETSVVTNISGEERIGTGDKIESVSGGQLGYYNHYVVFNANIELFVINTTNVGDPTYNYLPNLFSENTAFGMNLLVPYNYQEVYNNSRFGTRFNYAHKVAIENADYDGNHRFMAYNATTQKWEDSPAYVIDYENKTITLAQYVYHQKADGDYQILCNTRPNITQDTLVVPDSVWIDGKEQVINSLGNYAYRAAKVDVNKLSLGSRITNLSEHAFGKWNDSTNGSSYKDVNGVYVNVTSFTGYISPSKDYRTIAKVIDLGTLSNVVGFKSGTNFYVTGVEELYGSTEYLDPQVFSGLTAITSVNFPNVEELTNQEFFGCTSLVEASFDSLTSVSGRAFAGCTALTTINMPNLKTITDGAFMGATFTTINDTMFPSLQTIGSVDDTYGAFADCVMLSSIDFSSSTSLTTLAGTPFVGCTRLKTASLYNVIKLGATVFAGNTAIESISLPNLVELTNGEFAGCTSLKDVSIPNVTLVGNGAFANTGLTEISAQMFPKLTTIGSATDTVGAFENCVKLTTINFDSESALAEIIDNPFVGCTKLQYVTIAVIETLDSLTFAGLTDLKEVVFDSISVLNNGEFANCTALTTANFKSCTSVSGGAFENCTALSEVYMPNCTSVSDRAFKKTGFVNITDDMFPVLETISSTGASIGELLDNNKYTDGDVFNGAFNGCKKLESINLSSVTNIGSFAFANCTGSSYTATFASLTTMGSYAFGRRDYQYDSGNTWTANSISSFTAPNLDTISSYAFAYSNLKTISATRATTINSYAFYSSSLTTVDMSSSLSTVNNYAFNACTSLVEITLSAKTLGNSVFGACSSLTQANLSSVVSMGENVFYALPKLQYVDLTSLTTMGNECFRNSSLLEFIAPNLTTISGAGDHFRGCSKLTKVYAPALTSIAGDETFKACANLTNVYMPSITVLPQHCFHSCGFKQINGMEWTEDANMAYLPALTDISRAQIFYECKKLEEVYLDYVTNIGANGFAGCTALKKAYFPLATKIGAQAFSGCTALTNGYFPIVNTLGGDSGKLTFYQCTSLQKINGGDWSEDANMLYLPGLTIDAPEAFSGCTALTEVQFELLTRLRNSVFNGCSNLSKISFPILKQTGNSTFKNCKKLEYLNLPELWDIKNDSFSGCDGIKVFYASKLGDKGAQYLNAAFFANMPNLKVIYFKSIDSKFIANISDIASLCAIFEDGVITTPTTINLPIIATGTNAENYISATGYSRAIVDDLATEIVFMDIDGKVITYDELFNINATTRRVPVAVFKKYLDDTVTLLRMDTVTQNNGSFVLPNVIKDQNGAELYRIVEVADYAYYGINNLAIDKLTFGDKIIKVGNDLFNSSVGIGAVDYNNVVEAGRMTSISLTSICGSVLTTIAERAFANNTALISVDLPALQIISSGAFAGCTSLVGISFPSAIRVDGNDELAVFDNCTALTSVVFGSGFVSMTGKVFDGCTALATITINNVVSVVGFGDDGTILGIPSSATLLVPATLLNGYRSAWTMVSNIESFQLIREIDNITYYFDEVAGDELIIDYIIIGNGAIQNNNLILASVVDETKRVIGIDKKAMEVIGQLTDLSTLTLPTYLRHFDNKDLLPTSLVAFAIDENNAPTYCVLDGVLYSKDSTVTVLVSYPAGKLDSTFVLPQEVTIVTAQAFVNTVYLKEINATTAQTVYFTGDETFKNSSVEKILVDESRLEVVKSWILVDKTIASLLVGVA